MPRFAQARASEALRPLPAPTTNAISFPIVSLSPGLEAGRLVAAIAERLVLRLPAAAQPRQHALPALAPAAGADRQVALDLERAVPLRLDLECPAVGLLQAVPLLPDRAGIPEPGGVMAVVAERLVLRLAAAAERGAETHAGHVGRRVLDREVAAREERAVIS